MKRIFLLLALCTLLLAGCGQAATAQGFSQEDLYLTVNGVSYRCNTDIEEVIANLGTGYQYSEGMSCDYDGLDKSYLYEVAHFYTNPLSEGDMVNEIYTESAAVSTSKGITVGDSMEDVVAAYGEDYQDDAGLIIYSLPGERASLCFEVENGTVWAIYLTTQSV